MKALSIWQPWASLIISGEKKIETRSWPAPYSIRGTRIAIASTKSIRAEQRRAAAEDAFRLHYAAAGLAAMEDLPMGCVLGTVVVEDCREIDPEFMQELRLRRRRLAGMDLVGLPGFLGRRSQWRTCRSPRRAGALELVSNMNMNCSR